ncbi:MAG TPA: hypothetical protein VFT45_25975 [Longimicrobium sp.]|nr:hypothetical protein [Longimicrobium sp.]
MADSYSPATVSLGNLAEAAAAGLNLAQQEQAVVGAEALIGPTMGMYLAEP